MADEIRTGVKVMRRRARLYARQIVLALALTASAAGFLTSALRAPAADPASASQQASTIDH